MRFSSILYGTVAIASLLTQAVPVPEFSNNGLEERAPILPALLAVPKLLKVGGAAIKAGAKLAKGAAKKPAAKPKPAGPPAAVPKAPPPAAAAPKAAPPQAAAKPGPTPAPAAAKQSGRPDATQPATADRPATTNDPSATSKDPDATRTSTSESPSKTDDDDSLFCPLYLDSNRALISAREIEDLEKRAGEELWFRFEDSRIGKSGDIMELAARRGGKDFDDQAYKWISTNAATVLRGSIPKRVPAIFVMPAGTRDRLLGQAQEFDDMKEQKTRVDFVKKSNEPGDLGIQGVSAGADGKIPLDTFRDSIIRVVVKESSTKAGGKPTFVTIKDGKRSKTATKGDQAALAKFC